MTKLIAAVALAVLSIAPAYAQAAQSCICTGVNGCNLTADPVPPGPNQPTSCTVYNASGGVIATAPVVDSATIPVSNAASCAPADVPYNPGPAGSVACNVKVGPYPAGNVVTFLMTHTNSTGESSKSVPLVFTNVTVLPPPVTTPPIPTHPRKE